MLICSITVWRAILPTKAIVHDGRVIMMIIWNIKAIVRWRWAGAVVAATAVVATAAGVRTPVRCADAVDSRHEALDAGAIDHGGLVWPGRNNNK